jgi:hypothetical protein
MEFSVEILGLPLDSTNDTICSPVRDTFMEFSVEILGLPVDFTTDTSTRTALEFLVEILFFFLETLGLPVDPTTDTSTRTALEFLVEILGLPVDSSTGTSARTASPLPARARAAHVDLLSVGDRLTHLVTLQKPVSIQSIS